MWSLWDSYQDLRATIVCLADRKVAQ